MNEKIAAAILTAALREGKAGELLDCLFADGAATVDTSTGKLLLIPGNLLKEFEAVQDDRIALRKQDQDWEES